MDSANTYIANDSYIYISSTALSAEVYLQQHPLLLIHLNGTQNL